MISKKSIPLLALLFLLNACSSVSFIKVPDPQRSVSRDAVEGDISAVAESFAALTAYQGLLTVNLQRGSEKQNVRYALKAAKSGEGTIEIFPPQTFYTLGRITFDPSQIYFEDSVNQTSAVLDNSKQSIEKLLGIPFTYEEIFALVAGAPGIVALKNCSDCTYGELQGEGNENFSGGDVTRILINDSQNRTRWILSGRKILFYEASVGEGLASGTMQIEYKNFSEKNGKPQQIEVRIPAADTFVNVSASAVKVK